MRVAWCVNNGSAFWMIVILLRGDRMARVIVSLFRGMMVVRKRGSNLFESERS